MVIELKNDFLTVQFKEFGGALSSIKDKDGVEYLWQGNPEYGVQAPVLFPICGAYVMMKLFIVLVAVPILQV